MVFKGISHTHSTYSFDGTMSLADIKGMLRQSGYSFALMSEHVEGLSSRRFVAFLEECESLSDEHFLFVPGLEFHSECVSVNGLTRPLNMNVDRMSLLQECFRQGTFNVLVHPSVARQWTFAPFLDKIHAVEVWNCKYDGARFPSARNLSTWTKLGGCAHRVPVFGIDLHDRTQLAPVYMCVDIEQLSTINLLTALSAGRHTLHHRHIEIDLGSLSATTIVAIQVYSTFREVAGGPYRKIKRILPPPLTRKLRVWMNGRPDA